MADRKISQLDSTVLLTGDEEIAVVQPVDNPKDNKKITVEQVKQYVDDELQITVLEQRVTDLETALGEIQGGTPPPLAHIGKWEIDTGSTSAPAASNQIRYDNATQTGATELYIHEDALTIAASGLLGLVTNGYIKIQDAADEANYQLWLINGTPTLASNSYTFPVTLEDSGGTGTTGFADELEVRVGVLTQSGGGGPAIAGVYADIAAMLADQGNQEENALYYVTDASADATVTAGWAIYRKLAASTADLSDYIKIQEQESIDIVVVAKADQSEVDAGTEDDKYISPLKLATKPEFYDGGTFDAEVDLTVTGRRFIHEIAGAIAYTKVGTYADPDVGNIREDHLKANGSNKPTFSSDFIVVWDNWVNTVNTWNIIRFKYTGSEKIEVSLRYIST